MAAGGEVVPASIGGIGPNAGSTTLPPNRGNDLYETSLAWITRILGLFCIRVAEVSYLIESGGRGGSTAKAPETTLG